MRSTSGKAGSSGERYLTSHGESRRLTEPQHAGGRPLRVALVVPPYFDVPPAAYGGVEAVVADLADGLVEEGHQVYLIGAGKPGTAAQFVPVWDHTVPDRLGEFMVWGPGAIVAPNVVRGKILAPLTQAALYYLAIREKGV